MGCDDYYGPSRIDSDGIEREISRSPYHTPDKELSKAETGSASGYTFDNYQEDTGTTAIYPEAGSNSIGSIDYCIFGLIGEAGEIANKWKKFHRDGYDESIKNDVIAELGDVLWYVSQLATELDIKLGDIAADNIRKLADRKQRNVLRGSGDER